MNDARLREVLMDLPVVPVPEDLGARLRVIASHERERRLRRFSWADRLSLHVNNFLKPLAVPAAGGLLSSVLLFGAIADQLDVRRYLVDDVPIGVRTQVSVDDLSPFAAFGGDIVVEVTIDATGHVSDFTIPNGTVGKKQLEQIGNLLLYSRFSPATYQGRPVSGKILVALHHINVHG